MEEMPNVYTNLKFAYVDCDESEDIVDKLGVENVQTVVVIHPDGSGKEQETKIGIAP